MSFVFHPDAEAEFTHAIEYYEEAETGLGYDFATEVYGTIQLITSLPKAWPIMEDDIRRALVRRFPYGILYAEEASGIYIIAVMHLHRQPDYWKDRR